MKIIKTLFLTLFVIQMGFSQTEKLVYGKVLSNNNPVSGVDIINYTTKTSTVTNNDGAFAILTKPKDELLFYHKNYVERKIVLTSKQINHFEVELVLKTIELDEVKIKKNSLLPMFTKEEIEQMKSTRAYAIKNEYTPYGLNFIEIGKGLYKLVGKMFGKKDQKTKKKISKIPFKEYIAANVNEDYFVKELKLDAEEIPRFLTYCSFDPKSELVLKEDVNILEVMDFLEAESIEYKKLKS